MGESDNGKDKSGRGVAAFRKKKERKKEKEEKRRSIC